MNITLTEDQKTHILSLVEEGENNLIEITKKVFVDENIDGRSKSGRAVKAFLDAQNIEYVTTKTQAKLVAVLTEEQKEFLMGDLISAEMNPLEIARTVFNDGEIASLSSHHRVVLEFLTKYRRDIIENHGKSVESKWFAPKTVFTTLRFVNKWCNEPVGDKFEELTSKNRRNIEMLMKYLQTYKLELTLNCFNTQSDRDLFESEFVRSTWDKPDLTTDELNLYMMVCSNHVRVKHIQKRLDGLNQQLLNVNNDDDAPTMRLTEIIKATNEELNACEKRIEGLITRLNGDRSKRIEKQVQKNSFLDLVEEFQRKESRDKLVRVAQLQNKAVAEEVDRLESISDIKARIFGISKSEII